MSNHGYAIRQVKDEDSIEYDIYYNDNQIGHHSLRNTAIDMVVDHACNRAEAAEARTEKLSIELDEASHEIEQLSETITTLRAEINGLIDWRDSGAEEIAQLEAQLARAAQTIVTLTRERDEARREYSALMQASGARILELKAEITALKTERDEARRTIEAQARRIDNLQMTLGQSRLTELVTDKIGYEP